MKWSVAVVVLLAAGGCAQLAARAELRAKDTAMDAAVRRIVVVRGTDIPGHPTYTVLGPVRGGCEDSVPGEPEITGDTLKQAAYRKYGDRVDAIIDVRSWYVPYSARAMERGYFICAGTAVHFTDKQGATRK